MAVAASASSAHQPGIQPPIPTRESSSILLHHSQKNRAPFSFHKQKAVVISKGELRTSLIAKGSREMSTRSKCSTQPAASSSVFEFDSIPLEGQNDDDSEVVGDLTREALVWAALHGLLMGDPDAKNSGTIPGVGIFHAPISLFPSPFPRHLFEYALQIGPLFNQLADSVSSDAEFLQTTLASAGESDEFTSSLLQIHKEVENNRPKNQKDIQLAILRSDYMIDTATNALLQIELNTISSALAGLSSLVSSLHSHIIDVGGNRIKLKSENVLKNEAVEKIADAIFIAWKQYNDADSIILMVVQDYERNMYDQFALSSQLWSKYKLNVIRKTFEEIQKEAFLNSDGKLIIKNKVVSIIYFRAGYGPKDYRNELDWQCRRMMEFSDAIKCPTVAWQLAGTKKVQQELARPGVLERFVHNKESSELLRRSFAGLWSLSEPNSSEIISRAIQSPELFVLKPQREGGGNNLYGQDVKSKLEDFLLRDDVKGLSAYILMQRIFPPTRLAYLLRGGVLSKLQTISELGVFSSFVRNRDEVLLNEACGHVLRTKDSRSDEGGVASGYSVLDSPYLI